MDAGEIDRLMIIEPPRHGKSEKASRRFPAYHLGRNPHSGIIAASYNSDLAMDFGRDVRNIVDSPACQRIFPQMTLSPDSKAANRWHTKDGGSYVAAGVGTAVTGRDADIFLIDDPLKDREEANSERMRDRLWNWYSSVVQSRLPRAIILIQTRWHEDDLAGRLLTEMEEGGDQWTVLHHPAIDSAGEALWPERYPLGVLERIKRNMRPSDWSALFQGAPTPEEGDFFHADWFRWYDQAPAHVHRYGTSDYAITVRDGDFTVHAVWAVDPDDNLYLLDLYRDQVDSMMATEAAIDLMQRYNPMAWVEEKAQIEKAIGPFLKKRMRERRVNTFRLQLPTTGDKMARAQSFRARAAQGRVYLPKNAPWIQDFLAELLMFPNGRNDDQVDNGGLIGRMLDQLSAGQRPQKQPEARPLTLDQAIAEDERYQSAQQRRMAGL